MAMITEANWRQVWPADLPPPHWYSTRRRTWTCLDCGHVSTAEDCDCTCTNHQVPR